MNRLFVSTLALGLAAVTGVASAQSAGQPYYGSGYGQQGYQRQGRAPCVSRVHVVVSELRSRLA